MVTIAEGCWLGNAMAGSTNLELYKGRNYYWIISEPRENLDSGQPLVFNPEDVEQDQCTDKFWYTNSSKSELFLFRFHVIWTLLFKQV